jgi:hypothetical protein
MATRAHSFPECALAEHRKDSLRGLFHVERHRVYFDRSVQGRAKNQSTTAENTGAGYGAQAGQIGSTLIPGLERQAQGGQGLTPTQKNNALVAGAEAVGGAGAGTSGAARLEAMRTRNPGGFSAALDEAARQRGRQTSANTLGVENLDTQIANQKQREAQQMLAGLYGTDTSRQLQAMGLANEDLNTALNAGKTGWLQNTEGVLDTISGMGNSAAGVKKAFFG